MEPAGELHQGRAPAGFTALVVVHRAALLRFCCHLAGPVDGDDLLQETLTRALMGFPRLEDEGRFLVWCRQIARHAYTDQWVRRQHAALAGDGPADAMVAPDDVESAVVDAMSRRWLITNALSGLPERSRVVLTERADGVPAAELAARYGVSRARIDLWLHRSRLQARSALLSFREQGLLGIVALRGGRFAKSGRPHSWTRFALVAVCTSWIATSLLLNLSTAPPNRGSRPGAVLPKAVVPIAADRRGGPPGVSDAIRTPGRSSTSTVKVGHVSSVVRAVPPPEAGGIVCQVATCKRPEQVVALEAQQAVQVYTPFFGVGLDAQPVPPSVCNDVALLLRRCPAPDVMLPELVNARVGQAPSPPPRAVPAGR